MLPGNFVAIGTLCLSMASVAVGHSQAPAAGVDIRAAMSF
jgi:hypothetical protein